MPPPISPDMTRIEPDPWMIRKGAEDMRAKRDLENRDPTGQWRSPFGHKQQQASILDLARRAGVAGTAATGDTTKITGEASLKIALAPGLIPQGGAKTKGNLFHEIQIDRGAIPYASNQG